MSKNNGRICCYNILLCSIQLESDTVSVPITASIVKPQLELLDDESLAPTSSLHLGTTYYGTVKHKSFVVYNNSPAPVDYMAAVSKEDPPYGQVKNLY